VTKRPATSLPVDNCRMRDCLISRWAWIWISRPFSRGLWPGSGLALNGPQRRSWAANPSNRTADKCARLFGPPKHGSTAHRARDLRNSCSTVELCRRRSRIADAHRQQLFPLPLDPLDHAQPVSTTLEQLKTVRGNQRGPAWLASTVRTAVQIVVLTEGTTATLWDGPLCGQGRTC
jgi:hypothetical protein